MRELNSAELNGAPNPLIAHPDCPSDPLIRHQSVPSAAPDFRPGGVPPVSRRDRSAPPSRRAFPEFRGFSARSNFSPTPGQGPGGAGYQPAADRGGADANAVRLHRLGGGRAHG